MDFLLKHRFMGIYLQEYLNIDYLLLLLHYYCLHIYINMEDTKMNELFMKNHTEAY